LFHQGGSGHVFTNIVLRLYLQT